MHGNIINTMYSIVDRSADRYREIQCYVLIGNKNRKSSNFPFPGRSVHTEYRGTPSRYYTSSPHHHQKETRRFAAAGRVPSKENDSTAGFR